MRVSVVTNKRTESGSVDNDRFGGYTGSQDYESYGESRINVAEVIQQRDEALKREEASRDRMKLQETINLKQIQDLRSQLRKVTSDNQRLMRGQTNTGVKLDKKKDGNKNKELRDLNRTIDSLRNDKIKLQNKIHELSQFIKVMSDLKTQSSTLCREKDEQILRLQEEKELAYQVREQELNRRIQVEGELHSLQTYLEFRSRKNRENTRTKAVQTSTSIPIRTGMLKRTTSSAGNISVTSLGNMGNRSVGSAIRSSVNLINGSGATASYNALKSAADQWRLQAVEDIYKKETGEMRKKFVEARRQHSSKLSPTKSSRVSFKQTNNSMKNSLKSGSELAYNLPPSPPSQNRSQVGAQGRFQFGKHSATMTPAAIIYNARITVDN